ncbi:MAG: arsenic efflux protein [Clostridia bacterium]|nr:arsenic efflux protein [Clostridia bacterium]
MIFLEYCKEVLPETLLDFLKILPFLFLSFLLMEFLEHKASERMLSFVYKGGRLGPLLGGLLGAVPQCGFSAASAGLYAGRVISLGTLLAIFLSTSDEMIPIMIAGGADALLIFKILLIKVVLGILLGFLVDFVYRLVHKEENAHRHEHGVSELCQEHICHCEKGIWRSTLYHTAEIGAFLLLTSLALNTLFFFIGEESLRAVFTSIPVLGNLLSSLIGLIPNCASSIVITELYLEGVISAGCMFSGLLTGCGVGLLVLFRTKKNFKANLTVLGLLYGLGTVCGILLDALQIGLFLQ